MRQALGVNLTWSNSVALSLTDICLDGFRVRYSLTQEIILGGVSLR